CHRSDQGGTCRADLDCCGGFCAFDDRPGVSESTCVQCLAQTTPQAGGGQQCEDTADCCQPDPNRPTVCFPFSSSGQPSYCQACRQVGEPVIDDNQDSIPDYAECRPGLRAFTDADGGDRTCVVCRGRARPAIATVIAASSVVAATNWGNVRLWWSKARVDQT